VAKPPETFIDILYPIAVVQVNCGIICNAYISVRNSELLINLFCG